MPLFDFIARVPLLDLVPEEGAADGGGDGATSFKGMDGIVSEGSAGKCESMRGELEGTERRLAERADWLDRYMSLRVAVLARDGRGGGEVIPEGFLDRFGCWGGDPGMAEGEATAAKGSWSTRVDGGVEGRECLRERGGGFWRELRTRAGLEGGGGAGLVG